MTAMRFWEDFAAGERDEIGPHEITREDIVAFASRYDPQPFHLDEEAAKASMIGRLCASGWHVSALLWKIAAEAERAAPAPPPSPIMRRLRNADGGVPCSRATGSPSSANVWSAIRLKRAGRRDPVFFFGRFLISMARRKPK